MITDPMFYLVAVPAVIIMGLSKGGLAGSLAMISVPLMSLVVPPIQAAGILLPILIAMDVFAVCAYRRTWDARNLVILLPTALIGIVIGWYTADHVTEAHIRLIIGVMTFLFTLDYWFGWRATDEPGPSVSRGSFWGTIAGFTSFVSHAGGPPVQLYLLPQRMDRKIFIGTQVLFFFAVNWIKVIPYALLGQLSPTNLETSLVLAPLAPLSILAAVKLVDVLNNDTFYRITYLILFLISLKLMWDGVMSFFV